MKFVFVSYNYSPDFKNPQDWITRIKAYAGSLECLAQKHNVVRVEQVGYEGEYIHKGIRYIFTNFPGKGKKFQTRLNRFIAGLNPDVVVIHGLHYPLQVMQLHLMLNKDVKIIAQNHAEKPLPGIKKYLQRMADRHIDAYLFASKDMGIGWVKSGNLASTSKIHEVMETSSVFYPIDRKTALQKTGVNGSPVFLWVGRLNDNKDPLNVVKAFLRYAAIRPSARLYMLYHTAELLAEIKTLLAADVNRDAIRLIGKVSNDKLLYWYNSADFFLSGSHYEGSGTAVCEAMSCRCIPVVTDIQSFRMITDSGACGLLYQPGDEAGLLAALKQTAQLDVQEKREQSIRYFKEKLSFEAIARQMDEIAKTL